MLKKLLKFKYEIIFYLAIIILLSGIFLSQILVVIGCSVIVALIVYEFVKFLLFNCGKVEINTPDGSNQPYHPSVLYFKDKWNGYNYWMAYTPFPIGAKPYQDRWEYPCVVVSNDGVNWKYPLDIKPLDDLTDIQIKNKDYFSDTHLVYNEELNRLECYYRLSVSTGLKEEKKVFIFRRYSIDGIHWSDREQVLNERIKGTAFPAISPAIERINGTYYMWYVLKPGKKNEGMQVFFSHSEDGLNWKDEQLCLLDGKNTSPWHLDCKYYNGEYWLLTYDFSQTLILWKSTDGIHFSYIKEILKPSHCAGSFYNYSLYRSCMVNNMQEYRVYFSAGNERKLGIGLMKGDNLTDLQVVSASKRYNIKDFVIDVILKYTLHSRWAFHKLVKRM